MSVCIDNCQITQMIPVCVENLQIGTISSLTTAVLVYIEDTTLINKPVPHEVTSDGAGLVTITGLDTLPDFMPNHSYKCWITLASATSIEDRETITIDAIDYTCFYLRFEYIKNPDNTNKTYTNITLTPC